MTGAAAIEVGDLAVSAGRRRLLHPTAFRIGAGGTLVIMGETGAGKSLLAQAIMGALPAGLAAEGRVVLHGRRVDGLALRDRARLWGRQIAMLQQEPWRALDPLMAAGGQVAETHRLVAGLGRRAAGRAARADFAALGLDGAEGRLPSALSGGMAQRVAFAATRAGGAPVMIADEPTKGLDPALRDRVADMLAAVPAAGGTLIAITHDVALARRLGGRMMVLQGGAVVEEGPAAEVLATPRAAYTRTLIDADPARWPAAGSAPEGPPLLSAEAVGVARGGRMLLAGVDLALAAGGRVALSGPSGIGKTSLLDVLAGLAVPAAGRVVRAPGIGATGVQKLYQDPPAAFPARVALGTALRDVARRHALPWPHVEGLLERLGLDPALLERRPDAVSGGELQRIALVRALSVGPRVLLADEPTSRLDPVTQRRTMELIAETAADRSIAVALVTHDADIAGRWAHRHLPLNPAGSDRPAV